MLIQIRANFAYHSHLWPHAKAGDTKWVNSYQLKQLTSDLPGGFEILQIKHEDDMEVKNGNEKIEKQTETPGLQESTGNDSEKTRHINGTRRRYTRKKDKGSLGGGEAA